MKDFPDLTFDATYACSSLQIKEHIKRIRSESEKTQPCKSSVRSFFFSGLTRVSWPVQGSARTTTQYWIAAENKSHRATWMCDIFHAGLSDLECSKRRCETCTDRILEVARRFTETRARPLGTAKPHCGDAFTRLDKILAAIQCYIWLLSKCCP